MHSPKHGFEEGIKIHKGKKLLTSSRMLSWAPQVQECSHMLIRNILTISSSLKLLSALKSTWWVIPLFANLPQPSGLKNASKNIIKKKPLLKNVLLSTHKLKKDLGCLGECSMSHRSYCWPFKGTILGEEIKQKFKIIFYLFWVLLSSWLFSKALDKW